MPWPGKRRNRRGWADSTLRRATRARQNTARTCRFPCATMRRSSASARKREIDLVLVGPEAPLAEGIADLAGGVRESAALGRVRRQRKSRPRRCSPSISWRGTAFLRRATPLRYAAQALAYLEQSDTPIVIKASGLAAGKGGILPEPKAEAQSVLREMLESGAFGAAGRRWSSRSGWKGSKSR